MIIFELQGHDYIELHHLLKITGLCHSGAMAKHVIADGLVRVDNQVELRKRCKVRHGQVVRYDDQEILVSDQ